MTQATTWNIPLEADEPTVSPEVFGIRCADSFDAVLSGHSAAGRPTYAVQGMIWHDTDLLATTPLMFFDGTNDRIVAVESATGILTATGGFIATTGDIVATAGTVQGVMVKTQAVAVASLIAAATAGAGARSFVTDATVTTFASTVVGGGANAVPVVSDGTNWIIG
jgi:hypothetical protein